MTLFSLIFTVLITSCVSEATANTSEISPKGYWVDEYKSAIIYFNNNGDMVLLNRDSRVVSKDQFEFTEINADFFTVSTNDHGSNEINQFYKATKEDFFLGKWHGILNNSTVDLQFVYSNRTDSWELFENYEQGPNERSIDFEMVQNKIVLDNEEFDYKISDNKDTVILDNNSRTVKLFRGYWSYEEKQEYETKREIESEQEVSVTLTDATFFGSAYKYWDEDANIPSEPNYDSSYDTNLFVCSTGPSIPLGSLIEVSFEDSKRQVRTVNVVVTENDVLHDKNIGIVMERRAFSQLFEHNSDGYLPTNFVQVSFKIIDNLKK